ncbi:MAG: hypothetical protein ACD_46C00284G0003 [uncultured bacterium]|nr:MAG: hypothetical protein ACD_46C00284G0003 [uncultured bacterium]
MIWKVEFTTKASDQVANLSEKAKESLRLLVKDLQTSGAAPGKGWPHYGKLEGHKGDKRHCHLTRGRPTYVCCWALIDKKTKLIEIYYVGTHERAPY